MRGAPAGRLLALAAGLGGCAAVHQPAAELPDVVSACETNTARVCGTWVRAGDLYQARWTDGARAELRVLRLDRDSVVLVRDDREGVSRGMHARYRGARTGPRSAAGSVEWNQGGQRWQGTWEAEWSLFPAPTADPPRIGLPEQIAECETNTRRICGTWRRVAERTYAGVWNQGTHATLRVIRFDADSVVVLREDVAGPSVGIRAEYRGARTGARAAAGRVTWVSSRESISGTWEAEW